MAVCKLSPVRLPRIHDQQLLTLCWRSFSRWLSEHVFVCFDHYGDQYNKKRLQRTKVKILWLTVEYPNATIDRKTWKAELDIGTDRSSQTWQNPWVDWYWSGFGPPWGNRLGFWTGLEPNRSIVEVQTRTAGRLPGLIADTGHLHVITHDNLLSNNWFPTTVNSWSGPSSNDPYDLSGDDEEYSRPKNMGEKTPRQSDRAPHYLTAARLYSNL